jgi:hypothetical protein
MKIKGVKVKGAYEEVVVIPREGRNLEFVARAISDYSALEKLCPEPKAPVRIYAGTTVEVPDLDNPQYQKEFKEWVQKKSHWMVLTSLQATEGLEWETVNMADHTTWGNYRDEMKSADLSPSEINRIIDCVSAANGMDQSKIDEATQSFLAARAEARIASSPSSEQPVTPSGEPVSASA